MIENTLENQQRFQANCYGQEILNTGIADLLVVEVPSGITGKFYIDMERFGGVDDFSEEIVLKSFEYAMAPIVLPYSHSKYTVLGRALDIEESVWKELIPSIDGQKISYPLYFEIANHSKSKHHYSKFATASGRSFLKLHGIFIENPLQKPSLNNLQENLIRIWEHMESKITNPLILKAERL